MKLSIVVPVYNVENYLAACLDSVIDPALGDYEIVTVNDGSTDGSGAILADYARRYPALVRTAAQGNGGLGAARNTGLALAKGEYLLFLDSDDSLAPGALPEILRELDSPADILIFDIETVDESGAVLARPHGCRREGSFTLEEYPELLHELPSGCNKIWRRSLFTDSGIRFPGRLWFEDLATTPSLYLRAGRIRYAARPWYRYLVRSGSITRSTDLARNLDIVTAVDMSLEAFRRQGAYEQYREQLCYMAAYNQLIAAVVRVNLADPTSPVQAALRDDFIKKFPDFRENRYIRGQSAKYRLLTKLITDGHWRALHAVMRLNEARKG